MSYQTGANLATIISAVATVSVAVGGFIGWLVTKRSQNRKFEYPARGDAGENILSPSVVRLDRKARYAMTTLVPDSKSITVRLKGLPLTPGAEEDDFSLPGAWFYKLPPENWRAQDYIDGGPADASQHFRARAGWADLNLTFERMGELTIEVHEGDSPTPTWTKRLVVGPAQR